SAPPAGKTRKSRSCLAAIARYTAATASASSRLQGAPKGATKQIESVQGPAIAGPCSIYVGPRQVTRRSALKLLGDSVFWLPGGRVSTRHRGRLGGARRLPDCDNSSTRGPDLA